MNKRSRSILTFGLLGLSSALLVTATLHRSRPFGRGGMGVARAATTAGSPSLAPFAKRTTPYPLGECATGKSGTATASTGNPQARAAAQRGLDFLTEQAQKWQQQQHCYGCHVHAVTVEALSVGVHHQYRVAAPAMNAIVDGMLNLPGGAHGKIGLSYHDSSLIEPSKAFGGAAFARYDQWVNRDLSNDLLKVARELIPFQQPDGSLILNWVNPPVGVGSIQGTYQAIATWQQAYARSADDRWLTAVQKAEGYLQKAAQGFQPGSEASIQDINYTVMGLLAAGVSSSEPVLVELSRMLLLAQQPDGGWSFIKSAGPDPTAPAVAGQAASPLAQNPVGVHVAVNNLAGKVAEPAASNAFPTGQTLYTLRLLGMTDREPAIARGMSWLMQHQQQDGGWSASGFGKAEAMWGVLGLVSLDVLSVAVSGLQDGQHVDGPLPIVAEAHDNQGGGVARLELTLDDIRIFAACGDKLSYRLDDKTLEPGKHILSVTAYNVKGHTSQRTLEVYAGPIYLTQLGSTYESGTTSVTLRNIAPASAKNTVELAVLDAAGKQVEVRRLSQEGHQGPMSFSWDGKKSDGSPAAAGKYVAQLRFRDATGKTLQVEELPFVHDTKEAQRASYGDIQGGLALPGDKPAQNAVVELLDDRGNVVQRTVTTAAGQYRFKNVEEQNYRLRVMKKGFAAPMKPLAAHKSAEVNADLKLLAE